jgi:ATP-dependent Clp protease ATP-binding subunit ClpC
MKAGYYFTEDALRALAGARKAAFRLGHQYVDTEHLALGVLDTAPVVAMSLLEGASQPALVAELERRAAARSSSPAGAPDLPLTSRAQQVLALSMRECRDLGHESVDVEHLLLGLLREDRGIAAQVLCGAGVSLESVRTEAIRRLA